MSNKTIVGKLGGYFATGGVAAIVDAAGFALLHRAGIPTAASAATSFTVAAVVNFQLSSRFVFKRQPSRRSFVLFMAIATLGLLINTGLTVALAALSGMPPEIAKILAIGFTFVINFLLNNFVVFQAQSP